MATALHAVEIDETERRIRRDLAALYRIVALFGWDDLISTHISARLPIEGEVFLINPFGLMFDEITASSLVKVNGDGEILGQSRYGVNKAGFVIHSAVHAGRPDAGCVIHLHTRNGVAVSAMEEGLLPLNQTAMMVAHDIAYHEYEGVAFELDERSRLQVDLGKHNLMLLRNHGTLALGATIAEAFVHAYALEWACDVQVRTLGMARALHEAPPEAIAKVATLARDPAHGSIYTETLWPAMLRKLDRIDPSYKS